MKAFRATSRDSLSAAVNLATGLVTVPPGVAPPDVPPTEALSPRELDVARLAAEGLTNREIGRALCISGNTVKTHLAHCLGKLAFRNRIELARRFWPRPAG